MYVNAQIHSLGCAEEEEPFCIRCHMGLLGIRLSSHRLVRDAYELFESNIDIRP